MYSLYRKIDQIQNLGRDGRSVAQNIFSESFWESYTISRSAHGILQLFRIEWCSIFMKQNGVLSLFQHMNYYMILTSADMTK